jgi:hypothetical protein
MPDPEAVPLITFSARMINTGEMVRPSALAVFRLIVISMESARSASSGAASKLVLINPYRRRLPHEAGRATVLGTNF